MNTTHNICFKKKNIIASQSNCYGSEVLSTKKIERKQKGGKGERGKW